MKLTTVAQMDLPAGQVHSYQVQAALTDAEPAPLSFDQHRHAALGPRAGSWMALAFELPFPASRDDVAAAWHRVIERHGTLRTVVVGTPHSEDDPMVLRQVRMSPGHWTVKASEPAGRDITAGTAPIRTVDDTRATLRQVFDRACNPFAIPSHHLCLVEPDSPDERPSVVIGLDHCHVDSWSLLVLLRDFTECLNAVVSTDSTTLELNPVPDFGAHTAELAALPSPPPEIHRRWHRILADGHGGMPVFPLPLGNVSEPREEVVEVRDVLDSAGVAKLEHAAHSHGVRMLALAVAEMTRVATAHGGDALRAVFPVHSRRGPDDDRFRWDHSMGWFITNSVVESASIDPTECARSVREAIKLGTYALEPVLGPVGGMPHTPGMFAISWLDNRRLPVEADLSVNPQHVSATIRTTGVMVWFVIAATGLRVRCRYPDTPVARKTVSAWLDEVCQGLIERAETAGVSSEIVA